MASETKSQAERARYRPAGLVDDAAGTAAGGAGAGAAAPVPAGGPGWGLREWGRWGWRQLTSMRVALLLLMLLAVAALPGSFIPQRPQDPAGVAQYYLDHPGAAPWLERFGLFDAYASVWFAAIYLLLFVSLIGCIVPRAVDQIRALRQPPPRAPRRFTRFPDRAAFVSPLPVPEAVAAARGALRGYRVREDEAGTGATGVVTLSAERGYLREAGNIVFHLALVGLLVAMAYGSLVHYRGQVIVVEGDSFANSRMAYNSFDSGAWFEDDSLTPFRMRLDEFSASFLADGQADDFRADVTVTRPDGTQYPAGIKVNDPLSISGANIYLMGNGFAPEIQVHDASGKLAFSGAVPFIPADNTSYVSRGVIKVADTGTAEQIGLNGWFLPTAVIPEDSSLAFSLAPTPDDPALVLEVWTGDLGLDLGVPQNVYQLDTARLEQVTREVTDTAGEVTQVPARVVVRPGETVDLPDGLGTVTFADLPRFAGFDLRYDPTLGWVLAAAVAAFLGLAGSLFLPRRRVFLRLGADPQGRTVVTAAALARGDDPGLGRELTRVLEPLRGAGAPAEAEAVASGVAASAAGAEVAASEPPTATSTAGPSATSQAASKAAAPAASSESLVPEPDQESS